MVVLGDVSIYSTYCYLMELLREEGYETEMIPGVASFSAVAARLGVSLTTMEEPLHILPASQQAQWEGLTLPGTKVLMKSGRSLKDLVEKLAETGQWSRLSWWQTAVWTRRWSAPICGPFQRGRGIILPFL